MTGLRARLGRHGSAIVPLALALAVTASASGVTLYRIRPGDTLTAIAARYHTTVARLVALNHLPGNGNLIYAGAMLKLPGGGPSGASAGKAGAWVTRTVTYTVRPGDSLDAISARFHVNPAVVAHRNHLPSSLIVIIGQRLAIPQRVRVVHEGDPAAGPVLRGAHLSNRPAPSRGAMAAIIRATALRWGVDPRLALAVGYQESGFNQRWISATGAVGAMQVEPYTGEFVSAYVVHRSLDLFDPHDNATAGIALLAVLLRETHHNESRAVAGYYQGLASVQNNGMYADTKRYVADVLALRNRF
jgi:N-acetylmuramoyl-L-alanine amidase